MRKVFLFLISFLFFFLIHNSLFIIPTNAQVEFITDASVEYKFEDSGVAHVTHTITLENNIATVYAKSYNLELTNIKPKNITAFEATTPLETNNIEDGDKHTLQVFFPKPTIGKGAKKIFTIAFDVEDFADKSGEVWEVSIPKLANSDNFRDYKTTVLFPSSFGAVGYMSPEPSDETYKDSYNIYSFNKESISQSGISAGFGEFQVFSFVLNYHLENPLNQATTTTIAIPPDTAFQKMFYEAVNPNPETIERDEDGNWLAKYLLSPRQRLDVLVSGTVQIFAQNRANFDYSRETLNKNLSSSQFWQVNDPKIITIAKELKTPKAIYDYVTRTLSYDYERVKPNVQRLGAIAALENPKNAICMEFTDLFISLARANGVSAREINGYAYTENPRLQPLSLVADVLHSWPEYWDTQKRAWIPVDPTWGSTTGGADFFNKLDLRHFSFVIHGVNADKPYAPGSYKLGPNPQKDIYVNFGKLPELKQDSVKIQAYVNTYNPFVGSRLILNLENKGPSAIYKQKVQVYFDKNIYKEQEIDYLLPFSSKHLEIPLSSSFLGIKMPDKIGVSFADQKISLPSYKNSIIITSLIGLFSVIAIVVLLVLIRVKRKFIAEKITQLKSFYETKIKTLFTNKKTS